MDSALLKTLLTNVTEIAKDTKSSDKDVKSVLTSALPYLIAGKETTADQNKEVAKATGVDISKVTSIVKTAFPYVKEALKNVDTDKLSAAVSSLATEENLKKVSSLATEENLKKASDLAGKLFGKK